MNILYNTLIDMAIVLTAGALTWALISYFMHNSSSLPASMVVARPRMPSLEKKMQRERVLRLCTGVHSRNPHGPWDGPTGNAER